MAWWTEWWVWAAAAVVLAVLEVFVPAYLFLGFAGGAAVIALLLGVAGCGDSGTTTDGETSGTDSETSTTAGSSDGTTDASLGLSVGSPSHWHQFVRIWYS